MKKFLSVMLVLGIVIPSYGGAFKHGVKPAAKAFSFPFRHPVKSLKAVGHGLKKAVN